MTDLQDSSRSRLMTRWIGTGIGGVLLVAVLVLTFARTCVTSAQSHVLAVVLALGAALLLWGIVGGLQIDVKLKFKALGEVTAAGVAAIFLVVHFVSSDGIIASENCGQPIPDEDHMLHGRVHEAGKVTRGIAGATVKIETPDSVEQRTTDAEGQFDYVVDADVTSVRIWGLKDGYVDTEVLEVTLPLAEPKVVLQMKKEGAAPSPVRPLPTRPLSPEVIDAKPTLERAPHLDSAVSR